MPELLKTLVHFDSSDRALAARDRLEAAGIAVEMNIDAMAGWSLHNPATTPRVCLLVPETDYDRAREILTAAPAAIVRSAAAGPEPPWACPKCRTEVEPFLDVCWACGTNRDGVEDPEFEPATAPIVDSAPDRPPSPWVAILLIICPPALVIYLMARLLFRAGPEEQGRAGEAPPPTADEDSGPVDPRRRQLEAVRYAHGMPADFGSIAQPDLDAVLVRAWRTSVLGILCLPPLLTLYSTWLVMKYIVLFDGVRRAHWRLYLSLAVNLIVLLVVGYVAHLRFTQATIDRVPAADTPGAACPATPRHQPGNPLR